MKQEDYPALFRSADSSSNDAQKTYLWLIRLQYGLLFFAALIAAFSPTKAFLVAYAILISISTGLLIFMAVKKPEKDWYSCRALAESIKTETWRFMMRAEPFEDAEKISEVRAKFAGALREILEANKHTGDAISRNPVQGEQITAQMTSTRAMALEDRKESYRTHRIDEQRAWYVAKSRSNKRMFSFWVWICIIVQIAAIAIAVTRIGFPESLTIWPVEPLLVLASALIGWMQIKKFNELATAYSLTAHEIGIIQTRSDAVEGEADFSEFVNEAERAFSREHTQWVARQNE